MATLQSKQKAPRVWLPAFPGQKPIVAFPRVVIFSLNPQIHQRLPAFLNPPDRRHSRANYAAYDVPIFVTRDLGQAHGLVKRAGTVGVVVDTWRDVAHPLCERDLRDLVRTAAEHKTLPKLMLMTPRTPSGKLYPDGKDTFSDRFIDAKIARWTASAPEGFIVRPREWHCHESEMSGVDACNMASFATRAAKLHRDRRNSSPSSPKKVARLGL